MACIYYRICNEEINCISNWTDCVNELSQEISRRSGVPVEKFYLTLNGKVLPKHGTIQNSDKNFVQVHYRILGGKGGFGSMLRSIGAQIEKTTNKEACRDLSGRRMRDVNNEKKLAEWVGLDEERKREREEKKMERIERVLNPTVKPFESEDYARKVRASVDSVDDALKQGLMKAHSGSTDTQKRKEPCVTENLTKKRKLWFDDSESDTDEGSEEDDAEHSNGDNSDKVPKDSDPSCSSDNTCRASTSQVKSQFSDAQQPIEGETENVVNG